MRLRILSFILLAKRSNYNFLEKIDVFKFLFLNYIFKYFHSNKSEVSQKVFGFKIFAFSYDNLRFLFEEIFLNEDYNFSSLNNKPKIIDCGSNIGFSILYFKKKYPESEIIGFEPNPTIFYFLKKNIEQNNLSNVTLINKCLSNQEDKVDFFIDLKNKGSYVSSLIKSRGGNTKISVESEKLSNIIKNRKFDLIKIDVEGAEREIIYDLISQKKINNCKDYIIEYHHNINKIKSEFSSFLKHFESHNFSYNISAKKIKVNSYQDILLYFYKA